MVYFDDYLHIHDFPSSDFLRENKHHLMNAYKEHQDLLNGNVEGLIPMTNDMNLANTPLNYHFNDKVKELIEKYYIVEPTNHDIIFNLYVQSNSKSPSYFHNHAHAPMTVCGVMYLDVPKEGGEFQIFHYPNSSPENPIQFKPQEDKLYVFPNWLYHKPLPQKDVTPRICINIGYISNCRPITKHYGTLW